MRRIGVLTHLSVDDLLPRITTFVPGLQELALGLGSAAIVPIVARGRT